MIISKKRKLIISLILWIITVIAVYQIGPNDRIMEWLFDTSYIQNRFVEEVEKAFIQFVEIRPMEAGYSLGTEVRFYASMIEGTIISFIPIVIVLNQKREEKEILE